MIFSVLCSNLPNLSNYNILSLRPEASWNQPSLTSISNLIWSYLSWNILPIFSIETKYIRTALLQKALIIFRKRDCRVEGKWCVSMGWTSVVHIPRKSLKATFDQMLIHQDLLIIMNGAATNQTPHHSQNQEETNHTSHNEHKCQGCLVDAGVTIL